MTEDVDPVIKGVSQDAVRPTADFDGFDGSEFLVGKGAALFRQPPCENLALD
jgi:hypothetical protein